MNALRESLPSRQQIIRHLGSDDFFLWECYGTGLLGRTQAWIFRSRLSAAVAFLRLSGSEPKMILDVGCGPMFIAYPLLRSSTSQYVGIDILRPAALKKYKAAFKDLGMGSLEVIRASAQSLPFRDDVFDHVLCLDVLEHLKQPKEASTEMHRVSREGASIVVSLPLENFVQRLSRLGFVMMKLLGEPFSRRIGHVPITRTPEYHYGGNVKSYKELHNELSNTYELLNTAYTPIGFCRPLNINAIHSFRKR